MHNARNRFTVAILAIAASLLLTAATAAAATITGFADQGIGRPQSAEGGWGPNAHATADALSGQVTQARYNLVWDFASLSPGDPLVSEFNNWLAAVSRHGMRPLISFGAHGANPSNAAYRAAVQAFVANHPQIRDYTAWNEPNNATTFATAMQAAGYLKALTDVCAGSCTIAAGDFSGTRTPGTYYADYKRAVNLLGLSPTTWAYHPYDVVNNTGSDRFDGISNFWTVVGAASSSISVWFSEVGAFKCVRGVESGTASQDAAARRLNDLMTDPTYGKASRVYYYHLANGADCNWDTGLLDSTVGGGAARPALRTLFPSLQPPSAATGGAGGVSDTQASLGGTVDPRRLPTTYHFEYGTTTAYDSSTAEVSAGAGAGPTSVSATLSGLAPATTYHYRLVSTNFLGTTIGTDQQFTTLSQVHAAFVDAPNNATVSSATLFSTLGWQSTSFFGPQVAARTSPSVIVNNGMLHVFFVDASRNNTISDWQWNGSSLSVAPFGGPSVAAGSSPSAVVNNGTLHVLFVAASTNTISDWVWSPSSLSAVPFYGPPVAAGSSPSAVVNNGSLHVLFADASRSNTISDWVWSPSSLSAVSFYGPPVAAGSSPSAVVNNGSLHVLFADASRGNTVSDWIWSPSSLSPTSFYGDAVAAGSSPSAIVHNGSLYAFFVAAGHGNAVASWVWSPSALQQTFSPGHAAATGTSPSAAVW